jgi:predicted  nucleic acid-binding Zn-ribbon protein
MTKDEKITRIVELRKGIAELRQLKKEVNGRNNSKRLKHSKMNDWAKDCLDNSAWAESRIATLNHYIDKAKTEIERLKLELEFA